MRTILQKVDLQEVHALQAEVLSSHHAAIELALRIEDIASFDKDPDDLSILSMIREKKLKIKSIHAPFMDLSLCSRDPFIRDHSLKTLLLALNFARSFQIQWMVFHTGFHPLMPLKKRDDAYESFKGPMGLLAQEAKKNNITLLVENTYEKDFFYFEKLFSDFPSVKMVLDVGHCLCFSNLSPEVWLKHFSSHIRAFHLHDNHGEEDAHLSLGKGRIDFKAIVSQAPQNTLLTLETPLAEAEQNLVYLKNLLPN